MDNILLLGQVDLMIAYYYSKKTVPHRFGDITQDLMLLLLRSLLMGIILLQEAITINYISLRETVLLQFGHITRRIGPNLCRFPLMVIILLLEPPMGLILFMEYIYLKKIILHHSGAILQDILSGL